MRPNSMDRKMSAVRARGQEGVVLLVALITLIAMTLAGIGIMRSIDTGTMVAGNIGFRQAAVATGDSGIESARTWLIANREALNSDIPANGYYATRQDSLDLTGNKNDPTLDGVDWDGSAPDHPVKAFSLGSVDSSGNKVFYLIHRLCSNAGSMNAPAQSCATAEMSGVGSTQDAPDYSSYGLTIKNQVYYRVTARVSGPKNTVSYVLAVILL
jgi:type IV pilus assembly protein PilX